MNTPFNSHAWRELQGQAAAQLRPGFADRVLEEVRESQASKGALVQRWLVNPFAVSATTAAICLLTVMWVHGQMTDATNSRRLADWQEISVQTASLDLNP